MILLVCFHLYVFSHITLTQYYSPDFYYDYYYYGVYYHQNVALLSV